MTGLLPRWTPRYNGLLPTTHFYTSLIIHSTIPFLLDQFLSTSKKTLLHIEIKADPIRRNNEYHDAIFTERPWFGHLLFDNSDSDARDHCAAERSTHPHLMSPSGKLLLTTASFPLLAPISNIHGHRFRSNYDLIPPKARTYAYRIKSRTTFRPSLLGPGFRVPDCGIE